MTWVWKGHTVSVELDFDEGDDLGGLGLGSGDDTKPADAWTVETLSGATLPVFDAEEKAYYERLRDGYTTAYEFTDHSDIADLDRILSWELLSYRFTKQLGQGFDQHGIPLTTKDLSALNRSLKETGDALTKAKDALGVSKAARDLGAEEDPAQYLIELRRRALAFGIHRNRQVNQAIAELFELVNITQTFLRANDLERSHTPFRSAEDIVAYIAGEVAERVEALDAHFREHGQSIWVGKI